MLTLANFAQVCSVGARLLRMLAPPTPGLLARLLELDL